MEEPQTRAESGARYSSNVAQGQARVHYGNNYIEHQSITKVASNSERPTAGGQLLDFVEALKFGFMDFRLDSIDPPHADTCTWLFQRPEYSRWRDPTYRETNSNLLWIKGKAGSGKSTIMKCAYEYIKVAHPNETVISFFFNARGHELEKSVEGMYRSILSQALQSFPALRSMFPSHAPPDVAEKGWPVQLLRNLWRKAFSNLGESRHSITLLIDALDECPEEEIREALEHFEEFGQQAHARNWQLYICLASRYYPQITLRKCEEIRLDEQTGQMRDISEYVKNKLKLRNGAFSQELGKLICHRSSQVFLWVVLVVRRLNGKADRGCTRSQLIAVLNDIPEELEGLLACIIEDPDDRLIRTVQLVSLARASLNVAELYSAVRHSTDRFQGSNVEREYTVQYDMESFILNASRGLVEFAASGSNYRAQFIHEFVREYMLDTGLAQITNRKKETAVACSHADLAKCCQTYLSPNAGKSVADTRFIPRRYFFLSYAMHQVYYHMEGAYVGGCLDVECLDQFPWRTWIIRKNRKKHGSEVELAENSTTFVYLAFQYGCKLLARAILQRYAQARPPPTSTMVLHYPL